MRAGYQQTAEMLYLSNIRTQEGNKARTESTCDKLFQNMAGWHCRASQTGDAISAFLLIKWRCHIKLIWNPRSFCILYFVRKNGGLPR